MTGFLTTHSGEKYRLPIPEEWEISYGENVPCDSFFFRCVYHSDMKRVLRTATRFTAVQENETQFYGVIDEYIITANGQGLMLEMSGRGMAALLLDNEAKATEYLYPTMEQIIRNHAAPYAVQCSDYEKIKSGLKYMVKNGSSEWKAIYDFAKYCGGIEPRFTKTGKLILTKWKDNGKYIVIDDNTPTIKMAYQDNRYGVISEVVMIDKTRGAEQRVKNSEFAARGGQCKRVLYTAGKSTAAAMRYTGEYQIEQSKRDKRSLSVTLPGSFLAFPFDMVLLNKSKLGINGKFRVCEADNKYGNNGATITLTMCEV